ncbi:MAG: DUF898 domain-containing protein [Gammaproteobacteria bacterium]|nr:DUF898 domain-containing protein [Gammaproteobacteria bacterium]
MTASEAAPREIRFEFTGKAREYFGIWIVNVLLTVVTLGIYSAWAKVRRKRYFYGHTQFAGSSFKYLADPVAILKGWLLAVAVFAVYSASIHFYPRSAPVFMIAFLIVLPWLIVRSLSFNAHNSAFRNIRFHFERNYREAIKVFIGLSLLIPLTLGFIFPYAAYRQKKFIIDNSSYGGGRFDLQVSPKKFYIAYLKALGLLILCIAVVVGISVATTAIYGKPTGGQEEMKQQAQMIGLIVAAAIMSLYLLVFLYLNTIVTNLVWSHTVINANRFHSSLRFRRLLWLYFSGVVAVVLSLGLLAPWARIRLARYRFANLRMFVHGDLDSFIAKAQAAVGAGGEEVGEFLGVDIGL